MQNLTVVKAKEKSVSTHLTLVRLLKQHNLTYVLQIQKIYSRYQINVV